jgi:hypothetical protein
LSIIFNVDNKIYNPCDKVVVKVTTKDINGNGVSSIVGITITDETILELIEKRKQSPMLNTMVYLENEVYNLNDSNIYLSNTENISSLAIVFYLFYSRIYC